MLYVKSLVQGLALKKRPRKHLWVVVAVYSSLGHKDELR